jgi:hypothetical protein
MAELEKDCLGRYYPKATVLMAKEPYYSTYWTYQQFLDFVAKHKNDYGYHGHQAQIYEPWEGNCIGVIGIMFHPNVFKENWPPEFVVSFNTTAWAMKNLDWVRPLQTEWTSDLNTAYAMMVAMAYPNLELWEAFLKCDGADECQRVAIRKYQGMVHRPTERDKMIPPVRFTEAEKAQFVKNLGG